MSCEDENFHSHSHGHDQGDSRDHDDHDHIAPAQTTAAQSLWNKIDLPHVLALNVLNHPDDVPKLFKSYDHRYECNPVVKSDCDAQMIIHIPFANVSAKLSSIVLRTNGESFCAKTIRLWKNDPSIDFDSAGLKKPTFTIQHPEVGLPDYEDDEVPNAVESEAEFVEHLVPRHAFSGVTHLTIFIEDVHGSEDELWVHNIDLRGEFTQLSKDPVITLYELAANPADHKNMVAAESANFSQM